MKNNLQINLNAVSNALQRLPRMIGAQAVVFYKQRFKEQAWTDTATQPWKPRKPGTPRNAGRAILKDTGRLQRSIRVINVTRTSVTIGTDVPYAKAHNEGFKGMVTVPAHTRSRYEKVKVGTGQFSIKTQKERTRTEKRVVQGSEITVKAHTKRMNLPRRQFIGNSRVLNQQVGRLIKAEINKALNH